MAQTIEEIKAVLNSLAVNDKVRLKLKEQSDRLVSLLMKSHAVHVDFDETDYSALSDNAYKSHMITVTILRRTFVEILDIFNSSIEEIEKIVD